MMCLQLFSWLAPLPAVELSTRLSREEAIHPGDSVTLKVTASDPHYFEFEARFEQTNDLHLVSTVNQPIQYDGSHFKQSIQWELQVLHSGSIAFPEIQVTQSQNGLSEMERLEIPHIKVSAVNSTPDNQEPLPLDWASNTALANRFGSQGLILGIGLTLLALIFFLYRSNRSKQASLTTESKADPLERALQQQTTDWTQVANAFEVAAADYSTEQQAEIRAVLYGKMPDKEHLRSLLDQRKAAQ